MQNPQPKFPPAARHKAAAWVMLAACATIARASIPTTYPTGSGISIGFAGGHVTYGLNSVGDRIPDYSSAGYGGGGVTIPSPSVTTTLNPNASGDDTARIQAAIDNIGNQSVGANGFRGVLKLNAGVYRISTALNVGFSGIVIRGAGSGPGGTILRRTAANGDAITVDNGGGLKSQVGSTYNITTSYVPVGATYFALNTTSGLAVGDTISISRNPTTAWISQLPESQTTRSYGVSWDRVITEIDGNRIRVDAPVMQAIESQWGGGTVFKYTWTSRLTNVGIEDLRADAPGDNVDSLGNTDGNFASFSHCLNCWVRRCYQDKMRGHCVRFDGSKWCTAQDITCFHNGTTASHSGASIQIFCGSFSDSCLYQHVSSYSGGFEFTAGRQHGGPMVFTESEVPLGFAASGPHEQANAGMVWDNCTFTNQGISVQYQGKGWGGFDCLAYNCDTDNAFNFERPNTVHQWIIGCRGAWNHAGNGNDPEVISFGTHLSPTALYRAQLVDRVGSTQAGAVLGSAVIGDTDTGNGGGGGSATTYEAENLVITANSGDAFTTNSESGASNGQYVQYNSTAAGDFVQYRIPNVSPGSYTVTVGYKRQTSRGIVQTQVGPEGGSIGNLGPTIDMYGASAFTSVDIGTWTIGSTGNKTVRFNVTGKNASSSGFVIGIDFIKLVPQ